MELNICPDRLAGKCYGPCVRPVIENGRSAVCPEASAMLIATNPTGPFRTEPTTEQVAVLRVNGRTSFTVKNGYLVESKL
jgi:hypothetical protein